ncbi:hypothetical protein L218DRAFT_1004917 [Marasmius fiardii PR-910]|nr:hypothetical protein L218DRAFT_1004917 [Marasmius fiardii PR-910]
MSLPKAFVLTALTILAVVTVVLSDDPPPILPNECVDPRSIQCCQAVGDIRNAPICNLLTGIILSPCPDIDPFVGMTCVPATVAGGTVSCAAGNPHPLCCRNVYNSGVITFDCVHVTL